MAPIVGNRPDDKWYTPPIFENTDVLMTLQRYYRFGFNKDFDNIFSDSQAWKKDYIYGLFAISAVVISIFFAWLIFLVIFKLMGRQAGCMAGIPPESPSGFLHLPSIKKSSSFNSRRRTISPLSFTLLRGGSFFRYAPKGSSMSDSSRYSRKSSDMSSLTRGSSTKHLNETEVLLMKHIDGLDERITKNKNALAPNFFSESEEIGNSNSHEGSAIRRPTLDSHFFSLPDLPESVTEELSGDEDASLQKNRDAAWIKLQHKKKFNCIRLAFLLCGIGFILSSAFLMGNLVSLFQNSFASTQDSAKALKRNIDEAESITHEYLKIQRKAKNEVNIFSNGVLVDWCPGQDVPPIQDEIDEMNKSLRQLEDYLENDITGINNDLHGLKDLVTESESFLNYIRRGFDTSMAASVVLVIIVSLFVGGVILAWYEKATPSFSTMQTYILLPIFIISLTIICFSCCVFMVAALLSSDFCFRSPKENVFLVINNAIETPMSSNGAELLQYYIQGCPKNQLNNVNLFEFDYKVQVALASQHDFHTMLSKQKDEIRETCELEIGDALEQIEKLHSIFHEILSQLYTMQNIFLCSNFNQIYVDIFHEAICYNGTSGARRAFLLSVSAVCFGLLIISLRVSWHQVKSNDILIDEISKPNSDTVEERNIDENKTSSAVFG